MRPVCVWKIGGSLYSLSDLAFRLQRFSEVWREQRCLLVPGGGEVADVVRSWDLRFGLGEQTAHRLAIHSLAVGAGLLQRLIPKSRVVHSHRELEQAWEAGDVAIAMMEALFAEAGGFGERGLPASWQVTSDSLAAFLSHWLSAEQLILLKSVPPPASIDHAAAAVQVDPLFPATAQGLRVWWCNLRGDSSDLQQIS